MHSCPETVRSRPAESASTQLLRIFAYGTLKRGGEFHDEFCGGAVSIEKASVRGRLDASGRYPVLKVPETDILTVGSLDVAKDLDVQDHHAAFVGCSDIIPEAWQTIWGTSERGARAEWDWVSGELITLDYPITQLPALDRLEGFDGGGRNLYRRVLVPVLADDSTSSHVAWTYVA